MTLLNREALERGLQSLVGILQTQGSSARIRVVGGAALALRYFDRESTTDVDARIDFADEKFWDAVAEVGDDNGWPRDWLNAKSVGFIPAYGRGIEWQVILSRGGVVVEVASAEALLAMKLNANRPGRDENDIAQLMSICGVSAFNELEDLFEAFYPGEVLSDRAIKMLTKIRQESS